MNNMDVNEQFDQNYREWLKNIGSQFRKSQIKAATYVNEEMLRFYWTLGRDIVRMRAQNKWGSGYLGRISKDLQKTIPGVKSFSETNLKYMRAFYELYPQAGEKSPQLGDELKSPQAGDETGSEILFRIPWGHNKLIIDRCKKNQRKALFFVKETLQNNWSRAVLLNFLDTNLYERQGKAITNFKLSLPAEKSDLAQQITKDPYNFDFLTLRENYDEKELKDALMSNVQSFFLELGRGFALLGREYRLVVGKTEQFLDLLFYNVQVHCYVVIEVKTGSFDPRDMGQLGTYVAAVDGILRSDRDDQTVGLLICKTKDNVLAQYAVNNIKSPIGISEYELSNLIPDNFKSSMPTIEEIENELK